MDFTWILTSTIQWENWEVEDLLRFSCFSNHMWKYYTLNDWSLGKQLTFFPKNLNVSWDKAEGNIEIREKKIN